MPQASSADADRIPGQAGFSRYRPALVIAGAITLFAVIAIAGILSMLDAPILPGRAAYKPDPKVQDLYLDAVYYLETRQAKGLNRAMRYLEESARRKEDDLLGVRIDPAFKGLRADPRYREIVEAEGFVPAQVPGA